jgi:hypothetical protein
MLYNNPCILCLKTTLKYLSLNKLKKVITATSAGEGEPRGLPRGHFLHKSLSKSFLKFSKILSKSGHVADHVSAPSPATWPLFAQSFNETRFKIFQNFGQICATWQTTSAMGECTKDAQILKTMSAIF